MTEAIITMNKAISYSSKIGRIVKIVLFFCSLFLVIPTEAQAPQKKTDYTKLTLAQLKTKAKNNDAVAQFQLGNKYKNGQGVVKNEQIAIDWLKKAADNGHGEACGVLGDYYCDAGNANQGIFYLRKGASLGDGRSYYCLFLAYSYGKYGLPKNEKMAGEFLIKSAEARFGSFFVVACAYLYGSDGLSKDKEKAIYWGKKDCDLSYSQYLETGKMPRDGDGWPYLIKWLKKLGCDYDPALHVDDFKAWMENKPTLASSQTSTQQQHQRTSDNSNGNTSASVKYHYTKSGKGQSQNTAQWTEGMAPEECEVEFFDGYITVNGGIQTFVKESGSWKVYGGQSMGWGGNNTTFYYYVDANKNMKQVCESVFPYGADTFVYPMSRNGDPTPHNSSSSNSYCGSSSVSSSNSNTSQTQTSSRRKCVYCNGTGRIEKNDNAPANFGTDRPRQRCNECGKWYDPDVFTHYHQQCRHCGGTGYAK